MKTAKRFQAWRRLKTHRFEKTYFLSHKLLKLQLQIFRWFLDSYYLSLAVHEHLEFRELASVNNVHFSARAPRVPGHQVWTEPHKHVSAKGSYSKVSAGIIIETAHRKILIISPGLIFVQKALLLGLFSGELIFGGAYYWKEFCLSKLVGFDNKSMGLYSGGLIIGRIFASEIWGA